MKFSLEPPPKSRADCVLDTRLTPEQGAELAARLEGGLSTAAAAQELLEVHGIQLSKVSVGRWAARRRRAKADLTFARLLEATVADQQRAASLSNSGALTEANLTLLNRALFAALCNDDQPSARLTAAALTKLLGAVAKIQRAKLALLQAKEDGACID